MTRLAAAFSIDEAIETAWPEVLTARDPWSGDEALDDPGTYAAYLRFADDPPLDEASYRHWDQRFMVAYRAVLDGTAPWGATAEAARMLGIDPPIRHDRRPPIGFAAPVPDAVIADYCEDWLPAIGLVAPDRILGPWASEPVPRAVRVVATAAMAFSPLIPPAVRPVGRACKTKPRAPHLERRAMMSALRAPTMAWRVDGGVLTPLAALAPRMCPVGPVAMVPDAPAVVGRAVPGPEGWWLACGLPLPEAPDGDVLQRRLVLEYQRLRRHERRLTWEDLLRDRGEVVYRTACEWSWIHNRAAVPGCWASAWSVSSG